MTLAIPESPEQVIDPWLTSALRGSGVLRRAKVVHHTTDLAESQGAAAVVARFRLDYDLPEADAPPSVVAKFASPHPPIRSLMQVLGGYLREVEFYRCFGADPGIPIPRCYYADIDAESAAFVLLLEDMSASRVGDGLMPSVDDAEMAVRHVASFHARWWNDPRLRDLEFLHAPGSASDDLFVARGQAALAAALPAVVERFGSDVPPVLVTLAERLLANFDVLAAQRARLFEEGGTLVHGDYHPQQIFFPSERGGRFAVFDWQMVSAGNGGDDLARIIATGLSAEQQRDCTESLLDLYHSLVVEGGVRGFSEERCRERFRVGLLMSAAMNIIAWPNVDPDLIEQSRAAGGQSFVDTMFGPLATAIEAYDVLGLI